MKGSASAYVRLNLDTDICDVLPMLCVPTLVMHRKDTLTSNVRSGRYLADHIRGARLVELPGADLSPHVGDPTSTRS
jgi:pimeloyl-ACP methyl ester carboxylesterase